MSLTAVKVTPWRGFRAYLTKPHDGDSFWVMCDAGGEARFEPELRLFDVRAPELLQNPAAMISLPRKGQAGSAEATEFVNGWIAQAVAGATRRWTLSVALAMTTVAEPTERRTFTRYLARVWRGSDWPQPWDGSPPLDGSSLNSAVTTFLSGHPEWPPGD